jgi:hypothetical protein
MDRHRVCVCCGREIPEGKGVVHFHIRKLACQGACNDLVHALHKDYSRSKQGRFRTRAALLRLIQERRQTIQPTAFELIVDTRLRVSGDAAGRR